MKSKRIHAALALVVVLPILAIGIIYALPRRGLDGVIPDLPFADSRFATIDGIRLHYRYRAGAPDATLAVLIHGFSGSAFSWRFTLDALEPEGFQVVALDLPPFGYSERAGRDVDWTRLTQGLIDVVDPNARLVLVGHSMGARVAADVAASRPHRIEHLVLVGGTPGTGGAPSRTSTWLARVPHIARAAEVYASYWLINTEQISRSLTSAYGREADDDEVAGYLHPLTIPGTVPGVLRRLASPRHVDDAWRAAPTTLIWGADDSWVPLERALTVQAQYPGVRLETLPASGHVPMETHPEAFHAILMSVLPRGG
jgi:2-hydroxy-6-oxonona-2,4-dienedioate hydrolase